jgi:hypothetical protein
MIPAVFEFFGALALVGLAAVVDYVLDGIHWMRRI